MILRRFPVICRHFLPNISNVGARSLFTDSKHLIVASEVATMELLRLHGLPVPKIHSYLATPENSAGTEYIFMDLV